MPLELLEKVVPRKVREAIAKGRNTPRKLLEDLAIVSNPETLIEFIR
jgi:hypothetical protein